MAASKNKRKYSQKPLDTTSEKRGRGRPGVERLEIAGRAGHFYLMLSQTWESLGPSLIKARTSGEVTEAFRSRCPMYCNEFVPNLSEMIAKLLVDPKFPKRAKAQMQFLADSLAGLGSISARRSRDICSEERTKIVHRILRQEYYVECSCGYSGPAFNAGCRNCGTKELDLGVNWNDTFGNPL